MLGAGLIAKESGRARPAQQALGEDQPGAGFESRSPITSNPRAWKYLNELGFQLVGYGCNDVHRQQRPASKNISARPSRTTASWPFPC